MVNGRYRLLFALSVVLAATSAYGLSRTSHEPARSERMSLIDVPDAVRATILAEILHECFELEIVEEPDEGRDQRVFDVEFEFGDIEVELEIAADGTVLEKEVSHDEDDDEDDEDDDD